MAKTMFGLQIINKLSDGFLLSEKNGIFGFEGFLCSLTEIKEIIFLRL